MLNSFLQMQRDLEQDNGGHSSVLVHRKSGILSVKIVHMVILAKANIQSSVLRVHCPEVNSKAKAVENCRYSIVPIWKRLRLFFAQLLL